jgi:hypothetical protein
MGRSVIVHSRRLNKPTLSAHLATTVGLVWLSLAGQAIFALEERLLQLLMQTMVRATFAKKVTIAKMERQ